METLEADHPKFAELVRKAKMDGELGKGLMTVLAPLDSAFDKLEDRINDDDAESIVRNHLIASPLCCASVQRSAGEKLLM